MQLVVNEHDNHKFNSKDIIDNLDDMDKCNMQIHKSDYNYIQSLSPFNQNCKDGKFKNNSYQGKVEMVRDKQ